MASELQHAPGVEVILLGGVMRDGSPDLTGPLTEHCLELLAADIAFQGADYEAAYVPEPARKILKRWDERSSHHLVVQTRNYASA